MTYNVFGGTLNLAQLNNPTNSVKALKLLTWQQGWHLAERNLSLISKGSVPEQVEEESQEGTA